MHIPLNRWTLGAIAAVLAILGPQFLEPIWKVIAVLSAPHVPAM